MVRYRVSKHLESYSNALVKVVNSYPAGIVWSSDSLRIALNRFILPRYARLANANHVGYALRCLKTCERFKIVVTKDSGSRARYVIYLVNEGGEK